MTKEEKNKDISDLSTWGEDISDISTLGEKQRYQCTKIMKRQQRVRI